MAEMVLPNSNGQIKSALAKLSKEKVGEFTTNTSLIEDLNGAIKEKFGVDEDEAESEVSPEEQIKNNSQMMHEKIFSIDKTSQVITSNIKEIHASTNQINNNLTIVNSLLASSAISLMQVNALVSAFRADFIALNNGVDIKGESYINKALIKNTVLLRLGSSDETLKKIILNSNKVSMFPDLMSNAVRKKVGNNKMAKENEGEGLFSKLLGKLSPDMAEYGELALQFLPVIGAFTNREFDDTNIKTLMSSILGKENSKKFIDPLNELIGGWMNSPSNGKMFDVRKLFAGKINELTGLGDDTKALEKEKNPKKVFTALAPLADDIRDMVEQEYEGYKKTPNEIINKAIYATPVWIVNDPYQENGLKNKDDNRENETILKRVSDILMGRNVNNRDKDGKELFKLDKINGVIEGELLEKYFKAAGLENSSYDTQFNHIVNREEELKKRLENKRLKGLGDTISRKPVFDPETGEIRGYEWVKEKGDTSKVEALNQMEFENLNNLLTFVNPLNGAINSISEMSSKRENPLEYIKNTIGGSLGEIGDVISTVFPGHQSGRSSFKGTGDTLLGATVHEGEIIKSEDSMNFTNAVKSLNIVLSTVLGAFQSNSFLSRIKSQILFQKQNGKDIDVSVFEKPDKPDISKAVINETGKTEGKSEGKSGISSIFESVKEFVRKLKPKAKKQIHKKLSDVIENKEETTDTNNSEEENKPEEEATEENNEENNTDEETTEENNTEEGKPEENNTEEGKPEENNTDEKTSSVKPTEPEIENKTSSVEPTDPETAKEIAENNKENKIEENQNEIKEKVEASKAEAEQNAQNSIIEHKEQSKAEAEKQIMKNNEEIQKRIDESREKALSDEEEAIKIREKGAKRRNRKRDKATQKIIKEESKVPTSSKITKIISKIKQGAIKTIEKIKNSSLVKKLASAKASLLARIAERKAGSSIREGMRNKSLIKRLFQRLTGKTELAAGELANEQTNLMIENTSSKSSLMTEISGAISGAITKITDAIPFVGKAAAVAVATASIGALSIMGIKKFVNIIKGKKSNDGDGTDNEMKKTQSLAKKSKKESEKEEKKKKKKEKQSKAEKTQKINPESEIAKNEANNTLSTSNNIETDSSNSILKMFDKKELRLMTNVMESQFGKDIMRNTTFSSGFLFNLLIGDKMGFKKASMSAISKLSAGAAKVGSEFTDAMFKITKKIINNKEKYTDDLSDKSKNRSEDASLEFSKASIAKSIRNFTNKLLKAYDLDVIEDESGNARSLSSIKSEIYMKNNGMNTSTASTIASDKEKEKKYIEEYENLSSAYIKEMMEKKDKENLVSFQEWIPEYYKKLIEEYGSKSSDPTKPKELSEEIKQDFFNDLIKSPEWLLITKADKKTTKDKLSELGFKFEDWEDKNETKTGKAKYGYGLYGLSKVRNNYLNNEFLNASQYALKNNYKEKNGGTYPSFFNSYLSKSGINVDKNLNNEEIKDKLSQGKPVILMGSDTYNNGNTPFTSSPHYVVATGYDGKNISIEDPDEPQGSMIYNANNVLKNSTIKLGTDINENKEKSYKTIIKRNNNNNNNNNNSIKLLKTKSYGKGTPKRINVFKNNQIRKNKPKFNKVFRTGKAKYGKGGWTERIEARPDLIKAAQDGWKMYGILASVTIAQAIGESGWGTMGHGPAHNNWFGHSADFASDKYMSGTYHNYVGSGQPENWAEYKEAGDSFRDHAYVLSGQTGNQRYLKAVGEKDPYKALLAIANGGYCSPPDEYAEFMYGIIKDNDLTKYDDGSYTGSGVSTAEATATNFNSNDILASVEWSMKSYINEDELQNYVTKKGKYTRAYEEALSAIKNKQKEENNKENSQKDESLLDKEEVSNAVPTPTESSDNNINSGINNGDYNSSNVIPNNGENNINNTIPNNNSSNGINNANINNIFNNINVIDNKLGTTYIKNDINYINIEDMKKILDFFKELNNIQDDSLDVLEVIYEKIRKKKGKPKQNFNINSNLIGIHGKRYGV